MNIAEAFARLDLPSLQVAEAAMALGGSVPMRQVNELLGADAEVFAKRLKAVGVAEYEGGRLQVHRAVWDLIPRALEAGLPAHLTLMGRTVDELRFIARTLGLPVDGRKLELVSRVEGHIGSIDNVRALLKSAPARIRSELTGLEQYGRPFDLYGSSGYYYLGTHGYPAGGFGEVDEIDEETSAEGWAVSRGLAYPLTWNEFELTSQASLALRGVDYRAPFDPQQPEVSRRQPDVAAVHRDAQAQGMNTVRLMAALLDEISRRPLPKLKSGKVGAREMARLGKLLGVSAGVIRALLAVAHQAKLAKFRAGEMVPSQEYDDWLTVGPGQRLVRLLEAWWRMVYLPGEQDSAWEVGDRIEHGREARRTVLAELGTDAVGDLDTLARLIWWKQPLRFRDVDAVRSVLDEAAMFGVLGSGAVSAAGQALIDSGGLLTAVGDLGGLTTKARLQADFTATVVGLPSANLTALLDAAAAVEKRGAATTWRFSPASVRRAYDAGWTQDRLGQQLAAIADGVVPQPLQYLLADVARVHGAVRVGPAASSLVSDDTALLAQICADKRLAGLGFRLLAPSVLASQADVPQTVEALRKAGYAPRQQDVDGNDVIELVRSHRA